MHRFGISILLVAIVAATVSVAIPGSVGAQADTLPDGDKIEIVRQIYENINARDLAANETFVAANAIVHHPFSNQEVDPLSFSDVIDDYVIAFPDAKYTVEEILVDGDNAVARTTFSGTHTGDVWGIAASGKPVEVAGIDIVRFAGGKVVEYWGSYDVLSVLQQIGEFPSLGAIEVGEPPTGEIVTTEEENKAIVRGVYDTYKTGDLDSLDALIAENAVTHHPLPLQEPGLAGVKQVISLIRTTVPDVTSPIEELLAEGDKVIVRTTFRGTAAGSVLGIDVGGKAISLRTVAIVRIAGGKVVEHWGIFDFAGLLAQVGAIDPIGPSAEVAVAQPAGPPALDELLAIDGVVLAGEILPNGAVREYRSEIDIPISEIRQSARLIATANAALPNALAAYNLISSLKWTPVEWTIVSGGEWTVVTAGNLVVVARTDETDFNALYDALVGASE